MTYKFGDIIENTMASERNPIRRGVFVRYIVRSGRVLNPGKSVELTDMKGSFWRLPVHHEVTQHVVGSVLREEPKS